jgi:hypothetical protein
MRAWLLKRCQTGNRSPTMPACSRTWPGPAALAYQESTQTLYRASSATKHETVSPVLSLTDFPYSG